MLRTEVPLKHYKITRPFKPKAWIKTMIYSIFTFISFTALMNYLINPYDVFSHHFLSSFITKKNHPISSRMTKFYQAVQKHPVTIMMGTSRMGMFSIQQVDKYVPGPIYNMSMPGSTIEEQIAYMNYMIKYENTSHIILGLDFFSFNPDKVNASSFSYNRLTPTLLVNDDIKTSLFSFQTTKNSFKTIQDNIHLHKKNNQDWRFIKLSEDEIRQKTNNQILQYKTSKEFLKNKKFHDPKSIEHNMQLFQKFISSNKNIKFHVYLSPVSKPMLNLYKEMNLDNTFLLWKKRLQETLSFVDFCTNNSITSNQKNFRDASHVNPQIGDLIFAKLFQDNSISIPQDFGNYLEKKTSNEYNTL
jgi:hypothetical protein